MQSGIFWYRGATCILQFRGLVFLFKTPEFLHDEVRQIIEFCLNDNFLSKTFLLKIMEDFVGVERRGSPSSPLWLNEESMTSACLNYPVFLCR